MRTTIIVLVLLLLAVPAISAEHLYCSMPDDVYVYHFDVSIHTMDGHVDANLADKQGFNYLEITNFVKIGPSPTKVDYTEYRIMDVDFLRDDMPYRISVIAADKKIDFRDAPAVGRWVYGHTGVSDPLYVNVVLPTNNLRILEVK